MPTNEQKIIELLTEIKDEVKETRSLVKDECSQIKAKIYDRELEEWTCDNCDEEFTTNPYKEINKYQFCSQDCWENWSEVEN